jgi:energy-coupling factor transporter ATP-binding protein EcfA2
MELLAELNQQHGIALLLATHAAEVAAVAHRVVHMRDGRIERVERQESGAGTEPTSRRGPATPAEPPTRTEPTAGTEPAAPTAPSTKLASGAVTEPSARPERGATSSWPGPGPGPASTRS